MSAVILATFRRLSPRKQSEQVVSESPDQMRMAVPEPVSLCFHVTCAETQTNNLGVSLDE